MSRKTVLLTEMFLDVATPREKAKFDELYEKNNKGSATVLALRVIKDYWDLHIAKKRKPKNEEDPRADGLIRVKQSGQVWYEAFKD